MYTNTSSNSSFNRHLHIHILIYIYIYIRIQLILRLRTCEAAKACGEAYPKEIFQKVVELLAPEIDAHRARGLNPNHPHARGTAQCDDIYFQAVEVICKRDRVAPIGLMRFGYYIEDHYNYNLNCM